MLTRTMITEKPYSAKLLYTCGQVTKFSGLHCISIIKIIDKFQIFGLSSPKVITFFTKGTSLRLTVDEGVKVQSTKSTDQSNIYPAVLKWISIVTTVLYVISLISFKMKFSPLKNSII